MAEKIIITGGPHTGKTTLFNGLKAVFDTAGFVEEPARTVIANEGLSIIADPARFCMLCVKTSIKSEEQAVENNTLVIQDRSLIDTVAYARRDGVLDQLTGLSERIRGAQYTGALLCEFVSDSYSRDEVRYEDRGEAEQTHSLLAEAYMEQGLPIVTLPAVPHEQRLELATSAIHILRSRQ